MRIAQIAPLIESVPPRFYGGTERVVAWLTDELVRQGHDVTLFASGDSATAARLVSVVPEAIRLNKSIKIGVALHMVMLEEVFRRAQEFDILHFHVDLFHYPVCTRMPNVAWVNTLHGRLDFDELTTFFDEFPSAPVVSISDAQRATLKANWQATIHHGLPADLYNFHETPSDYLLFLGRISPEKRVDRAIEIANRTGQRLVVAAKVDPADEKYFEDIIKPLLNNPLVEFIGEVSQEQKDELIGKARALLFPIDWPEPFGLVMIEAMACGTPIIAWNHGSVPEILETGVTGFICSTVEEAVKAVGNIELISRRKCREVFDQKFEVKVMADKYLSVYNNLFETVNNQSGNPAKASQPVAKPIAKYV